MLIEIAQPISLLVSILSLYSVFHAAFLAPVNDPQQRILPALSLLVVAAAVCLASGLIFCDALEEAGAEASLLSTLPVQLLCWAAGVMMLLFLASWYLDTHCVFYRDVRRI